MVLRTPALAALAGSLLITIPACGQSSSGQSQPLAMVDGEPITEADLADKAELIRLQQELYQARSQALEETIGQRLLTKEAERRGITLEQLEEDLASKADDPTDEEMKAFYDQQRSRIRRPFEDVKDALRRVMKQMELDEAKEELIADVRTFSKVEVFLDPPRLEINLANAHRRGSPEAPVTLVEFSDYQCPFCRRMQAMITELYETYDGKVSWVYKDLPLASIHSQAQTAAEAARCAGDQGKFWEFRDALFAESRITPETFGEISASLSLDADPFQACLDSRKYRDAVEADSQEAQSLGITGTPTFAINGILLPGAQPKKEFIRLIESELALQKRGAAVQN